MGQNFELKLEPAWDHQYPIHILAFQRSNTYLHQSLPASDPSDCHRFSVEVLRWPHKIASIQLSPSSHCVQLHVLPYVLNESQIIFRKCLRVRIFFTRFIKGSGHHQIPPHTYRYHHQWCRYATALDSRISILSAHSEVLLILPLALSAG